MTTRLQALLSLRSNYSLKGCWVWLATRHCFKCGGAGRITSPFMDEPPTSRCPKCEGRAKRGYQRILSEPERVKAEQEAVAEGVFV